MEGKERPKRQEVNGKVYTFGALAGRGTGGRSLLKGPTGIGQVTGAVHTD
jgi:hypothetical protein